MDFSFFDGLIDSVFVINSDRGVVYCNESAAKLCDSSVRRLAKGKPIFEIIEFSNDKLFVMPSGEDGKLAPAPYQELHFSLKSGKKGKVQIAIQPFSLDNGEARWAVMIRDVTLEEVLHAKYHKQLEEKEVFIHQLQEAKGQLENYSKNLEKMVDERTQEVKKANIMLSAIMNSLGQGFLVFDQSGLCSDFYTKACESILEGQPANKNIKSVLKLNVKDTETFDMWQKAAFSESLPFETMKDLAPKEYIHSEGKHILLDYFPLRNEGQTIENIVLVATDKTAERDAQVALEKEKKFAKMITKLVTCKRQFSQFLSWAPSVLLDVRKELSTKREAFDYEMVFRWLHTLEGEAGSYSIADVWTESRVIQSHLEPIRKGENYNYQEFEVQFLKNLSGLEETFHNFVTSNSELFKLVGIGTSNKIEISVQSIEELLHRLELKGLKSDIINELSDELLREPISQGLSSYVDVVATVAGKLGKKVNPLKFKGEDTRVYLSRYQELLSSLVHAFRNAVDHGIEPSEEREMMGKSPEGNILVSISRLQKSNKNHIVISIEDDGGGVSADKIRQKMTKDGQESKLLNKSDEEVIQLIFDSGITTKVEVGEFSGRGVGLNAVKAEAESLGGKAWVETQLGQGSKIIIEVPDVSRVAQSARAA